MLLQCGMACHFVIRQVGGFALFTDWEDAEVTSPKTIWLVECHGNVMKFVACSHSQPCQVCQVTQVEREGYLGSWKVGKLGKAVLDFTPQLA